VVSAWATSCPFCQSAEQGRPEALARRLQGGPGVGAVTLGFPHARGGRVREIYRFGPIAEKQEKNRPRTARRRRNARECMGRAFCCSAAGYSAGRPFAEVYPCRASRRSFGSAAIGEKRRISLAHPPRVCPDHRGKGATLDS
jgi:hypothetical protein